MLPLLIVLLFKVYKYLKESNLRKEDPNSWDNRITFYCTFLYPVYYFTDALISVWEGTFLNTCRFAFWFHHVVLFFYLKLYFVSSYL